MGRGTAPEVAFQDDTQAVYADNVISDARASQVMDKAKEAGGSIALKALKTSGLTKKLLKNAARNLKRKIRKPDKWPDPYWFDARVWDRVEQEEKIKRICIMLPSEVLELIWGLL